MSLKKSDREMMDRIAKEIASESIARKKDPDYITTLDKVECIRKLASITDLEYNIISEMMEAKIEKYKRIPGIF